MKVNSSHSLVSHCTSSSLGILNSTHGMKLTPKTPPEKRSWLMTLSFFFHVTNVYFTDQNALLLTSSEFEKWHYQWTFFHIRINLWSFPVDTASGSQDIAWPFSLPVNSGMQIVPVFTLRGHFDFKIVVTKFCSLGKLLLA